jgi:hypothetical protein
MQIKNKTAEIFAFLDPQFTIEDFYNEFIKATDNILKPYHLDDAQSFDADLECYFLDESKTQPLQLQIYRKDHDSTTSYFAVKVPSIEKSLWITQFINREWSSGDKSGISVWNKQNLPALKLQMSHYAGPRDPSFTVQMQFGLGVIGLRTCVFEAQLKVIEEDLELNGADSELEKYKSDLLKNFKEIQSFENSNTEIFHELEKKLQEQCLQVLKKFAKGPEFLVVDQRIQSPVETLPKKNTPQLKSWSRPSRRSLELDEWAKRISWRGLKRERAIRLLISRKQDEGYAEELMRACLRNGKGSWPGLVEVLSAQPISFESQKRIITFVADPNWPGAELAQQTILQNRAEFDRALRASLQNAIDCQDEWWAENIQALIDADS